MGIAPSDWKRYDLEIKFSRMKLAFVFILVFVVFATTMVESTPYGMAGIGGCPCADFSTTAVDGGEMGKCKKEDQTKYYFCFVNIGCRNCEGPSRQFPQYCKNYSNCRLWGRVNPEG